MRYSLVSIAVIFLFSLTSCRSTDAHELKNESIIGNTSNLIHIDEGLRKKIEGPLASTGLSVCLEKVKRDQYYFYACKKNGKKIPQEEVVVYPFFAMGPQREINFFPIGIPSMKLEAGLIQYRKSPETGNIEEYLTEFCTGKYASNCKINLMKIDDRDQISISFKSANSN